MVVDATRTLTLSTAEVVGMGGAGIGFATGASGLFFSPEAPANRRLETRSTFSVSATFNRHGIGPMLPSDVANLGVAGPWTGALTNFGASAVYKHVGAGLALGLLSYEADDASVALAEGHLSGGGSFWDGHIVAGAGWRLLTLAAEHDGKVATFGGSGPELGITLNRLWGGWNLGVTLRSEVEAERTSGKMDPEVGAVAVPAQIAVGMGWYDEGSRPLRVAADVVIDGPVRNGVAVESLLLRDPQTRGAEATVTPHLGVEVTALPDRLRWRAGAYLEPARVADSLPRAHGTTGFELRLFHLDLFGVVEGDLSWEAAVDVAPRYIGLSWLGIGFWQRGVTGVGWERPVPEGASVAP